MKIHTLELLSLISNELRADGSRIVHCHGCWDILHPGHNRHLQSAAKLGDVLIVTVTADEFVAKGPDRPIFPAQLRCEALAALACVDYVAISPAPTAADAIRAIRPHVYVKGPACRELVTPGLEAEIEAVCAAGGEIAYTNDMLFSSTDIIRRLG